MNKQKLQQIAFNHLLDIDFKNFMNLYKICTAKLFSFLVIETTLASDNPLHFRKNLLEKIKKYKTRDEKLQYEINNAVAKISVLSSGKIDKYEYLTGK